jgi:hypothetical protein
MADSGRSPIATPRRLAYWLVLLATLLVTAEGLSLAFAKLRPGLFSQQDKVLATLRGELDRYPEFLARAYDPVLGWDNVPGDHREPACDGRPVAATVLPDRSRRTPVVEGRPEVLLVGDSYGAEVNDEETFAWRLSERLGATVVNHGVPGYSPVQAALKFEHVAEAHPRARAAVLAITHVDLARMMSRYRPLVDPRLTWTAIGWSRTRTGRHRSRRSGCPSWRGPPSPRTGTPCPRRASPTACDWRSSWAATSFTTCWPRRSGAATGATSRTARFWPA